MSSTARRFSAQAVQGAVFCSLVLLAAGSSSSKLALRSEQDASSIRRLSHQPLVHLDGSSGGTGPLRTRRASPGNERDPSTASSPLGYLVPYNDGLAYQLNATTVQARVTCYPDFDQMVWGPSAVLTDMYGLQAMLPLTPTAVLADAAERNWTVVATAGNTSLRLQITNGALADFYFSVPILLSNGAVVAYPFADVVVQDPCAYLSAVAAFRNQLFDAGLAAKYLPPNPYFIPNEWLAYLLLNTTLGVPSNITLVSSVDALSSLPSDANATLIIPDRQHDLDTQAYAAMSAAISASYVDWVGMEMVECGLQPALDVYLTAVTTTPEWQAAEATLQAGVNSYYFSLVQLMRTTGRTTAYALDAAMWYDAFRYGEFTFGAAVRSTIWVNNSGVSGRGVLMGSSSHFSGEQEPVFAAAYALHSPASSLLMLDYSIAPGGQSWLYAHWWEVLIGTFAGSILLFLVAVAVLVYRPDPKNHLNTLDFSYALMR